MRVHRQPSPRFLPRRRAVARSRDSAGAARFVFNKRNRGRDIAYSDIYIYIDGATLQRLVRL